MIEHGEASPDRPEVLFLGEPARDSYAEGALRSWCRLTKVAASQALADSDADQRLGDHAVTILSDYPSANLTDAHQQRIVEAVERGGRGLLMIGGWASFGAPRGGYCGSRVADLLPVQIGPEDDRVNTPLGTVLRARIEPHPAIRSIQGQDGCVVVGYNRVLPRDGATVLIAGYQLQIDAETRPCLQLAQTPMLSVWQRGSGRVAAFAPDVMPHWAGGIVDWGDRRIKLPTGYEVGNLYVALLVDLCRWLAGQSHDGSTPAASIR